jgi:hypothetical protein
MAMLPEPSEFSSSIVVTIVDSRSEAVISRVLPSSRNKKLSKIGNVFFELMTRLNPCRWFNKSILDITNLIWKNI